MRTTRKRGPIPKIETPVYRAALRAVMEGPWTAKDIAFAFNRSERAIVSDMGVLVKEALETAA